MINEVIIEKLVYGGEGLARTPEGIVLIPGTLPGERVSIEVEPAKRGVRRARIIDITAASPVRIAAKCRYFAECGGCHHQHAAYQSQLEWKREILAESFERIAKLKLEVPIETISSEPWGYRNRVRLHARKQDETFQIGYLESGSQVLCSVEECPISSPAIQDTIRNLTSSTLKNLFPQGQFEIELLAAEDDQALLATVSADLPCPEGFGLAWQAAMPAFESGAWTQRRKSESRGRTVRGRHREKDILTVWGPGGLTIKVGEFHYRVSHHSFFQTNRFLLDRMIEIAIGDGHGERALDLFAGVGFFTLPLANRYSHVIAVEPHKQAAVDLRTNSGSGAAASQIHVYPNTAESFLDSRPSRQPWDLIMVDPPRQGLSAPVREAIVALQPRRVTYISCDPTTLARDMAVLRRASYRIQSVHLIDLFPQTYHLEAIVHLLLER